MEQNILPRRHQLAWWLFGISSVGFALLVIVSFQDQPPLNDANVFWLIPVCLMCLGGSLISLGITASTPGSRQSTVASSTGAVIGISILIIGILLAALMAFFLGPDLNAPNSF